MKFLKKAVVLLSLVGMAQLSTAEMVQAQDIGTAEQVRAIASKRTVNVNINALGVFGWFSGSANWKVSKALTVGPYVGVWTWTLKDTDNNKDDPASGKDLVKFGDIWSIGLQANYAFNGNIMASGWIVSPMIAYTSVNKDLSDNGKNGIAFDLPFSYQWMWSHGFNLQLGIGPAYSATKSGLFQSSGMGVSGNFNLGYAF